MRILLLILLLLAAGNTEAFSVRAPTGNTTTNFTCSDKVIGAVGTGIYAGYTLEYCENFQTPLDIMGENNGNYGKYLPVSGYANNTRIPGAPDNQRYSGDPYNTGWQDANRGVPVGFSDILVQNGSLAEKMRIMTGGEQSLANSMTNVGSRFFSVPWMTFTAPAIIEFYSNYPSGAPAGWHPTDWVMQVDPYQTVNALEIDLCEGSSQYCSNNTNVHGTVGSTWGNNTFSLNGLGNYGANHLYTEKMDTSNATLYVDGTQKNAYAGNTTVLPQPYEWIITAVTYNNTFNGDTGLNQTAWNSAGASGAVFSTQYVRVWLPNAAANNVMIPFYTPQHLQVAYNGAGTAINYTYPACGTAYSKVTPDSCYMQALPFENSDAGVDPAGSATQYTRWPAGLSLSGSAVSGSLSGVGNHPGRLHLIMVPTKAGGSVGYTYRDYVDVGPNITSSSISYSNGTATYDTYPLLSVGSLMPLTCSMSGLPTGLSFNTSNCHITGTATTGTYTVNLSVTNVSGQTASNASESLVVGP